MVGRLLSFWEGLFLGANCEFQGGNQEISLVVLEIRLAELTIYHPEKTNMTMEHPL